MKVLMNCDQVFEVLTRGPFPTGAATDQVVEQHLAACHDCRRLAEALRPAVALLHEAVTADQALDLPEYQGSLPPWQQRDKQAAFRLLTQGMRRVGPPPAIGESSRVDCGRLTGAVRLLAACLLVAALAVLLYGVGISASRVAQRPVAASPIATERRAHEVASGESDRALPAERRAPGAGGLLTLASFKLRSECLPPTHRAKNARQAEAIASAMADGSLDLLRCCTECHHAGHPRAGRQDLAGITGQTCALCHRG